MGAASDTLGVICCCAFAGNFFILISDYIMHSAIESQYIGNVGQAHCWLHIHNAKHTVEQQEGKDYGLHDCCWQFAP